MEGHSCVFEYIDGDCVSLRHSVQDFM